MAQEGQRMVQGTGKGTADGTKVKKTKRMKQPRGEVKNSPGRSVTEQVLWALEERGPSGPSNSTVLSP